MLFAPQDTLSGVWKVDFDTRLGIQNYSFTFQQSGTNLTGSAEAVLDGNTRQVELRDINVMVTKFPFGSKLSFGDREIRIDYTGKITAEGIAFTRKVGEFASEEAVASEQRFPSHLALIPQVQRQRNHARLHWKCQLSQTQTFTSIYALVSRTWKVVGE